MDRDTFIIFVYCLVEEHYRALTQRQALRHGGFEPELTDPEVITMEICGEYWKLHAETDLFDYFRDHYRHFFPKLSDRTLFARQAANLCWLKARLQQRLVHLSGQASDPVQPIDTVPLPVCTYTRAGRDRCFVGLADFGHCAAKRLDYYGFKLGLRVSRCGMITAAPLLAARTHDINHTGALIEGFSGLVPADKGFLDAFRQSLYQQRQGVRLIVPTRKNMAAKATSALERACGRWRRIVETVGSQLTERFGVTRIRVRDLWHFQHRLIRKILSHTVAVFLNLQLGRAPLDLDGLVSS
ncbi:MAG TPA: IS982 family transposase [Blastocatellia bacterium]|nr:IS982 family transposase [Blastocatellia bacterium]